MSTRATANGHANGKVDAVKKTVVTFFEKQQVKEFLAEFIGTFLLLVIGLGVGATYTLRERNGQPDIFAIGFVWGMAVMIGVSISAVTSGGHLNPALTVAFAVLRKFPWGKVWYYMLAQYLGAFFGAVVIYITYLDGLDFIGGEALSAYGSENSTGGVFATYPSASLSITGALLDQIISTALLAIAVLAITDVKRLQVPIFIQPLLLGLVVATLVIAFHINCGAPLNPARDLAPRLFTAMAGWGWQPFEPLGGHYWYAGGVIGPHVGAIVGGCIYLLIIDHEALGCGTTSTTDEAGNVEASAKPSEKTDTRNNSDIKLSKVSAE